jgi:hypothetical protein
MADHKAFPLTQRVLHLFKTDLDLQQLAAIGYGKSEYGALFGRTTWPER